MCRQVKRWLSTKRMQTDSSSIHSCRRPASIHETISISWAMVHQTLRQPVAEPCLFYFCLSLYQLRLLLHGFRLHGQCFQLIVTAKSAIFKLISLSGVHVCRPVCISRMLSFEESCWEEGTVWSVDKEQHSSHAVPAECMLYTQGLISTRTWAPAQWLKDWRLCFISMLHRVYCVLYVMNVLGICDHGSGGSCHSWSRTQPVPEYVTWQKDFCVALMQRFVYMEWNGLTQQM